ncbi:hypothetical protein HDA40_004485 [Hamadaea flava]|uniref:Transcriptional regulator, AbiEi antitoxin, Type IV TA system n=1 Tax=Hamadaea flava TaxID=1742688 RepID=A0ABV8LG93_9ACTN|nr:hypothetical protein [Hamadaea flava]MCP2325978.1 hypothetical protein [Hamadaea flava]
MDALAKLLHRQEQLATYGQLRDVGFTQEAIRWRVRRGTWQRVLPRVVATFSGTLTRRQQFIAAGLYAGERAQLAGLSALEIHGFRYAPRESVVHVLLPERRRLARVPRVQVHRTDRLDPTYRPYAGCVRVCSPARAVVDAMRTGYDSRTARAVVAEAVQNEITTVRALREELESARRNGTAVLRAVLDEVADGVRSAPEAELRALTQHSLLLPAIRWNPQLAGPTGDRLPTPDGYLEEAGIALEVDSREFHLNAQGWEAALRHHNLLAAAGILVLHFTPRQIRESPQSVLAEIERAYVERLRAGVRPGIRFVS